jgi:hypothetical protein
LVDAGDLAPQAVAVDDDTSATQPGQVALAKSPNAAPPFEACDVSLAPQRVEIARSFSCKFNVS